MFVLSIFNLLIYLFIIGQIYLTDDEEGEKEIQEQAPLVNGVEYQVPIVDSDSVIATRTRSRKSSVSESVIKAEKEETVDKL